MAYNSLRSKLNRAIAAYLINAGCGGKDDVSPFNSVTKNAYPITIVHSTISKPEVPLTGIRRITVHISIKSSAVTVRGEPNPDQARLDFDERVAQTYDALMLSDDGQTLNYTARAITEAGRALAVPVDNSDAAKQLAANNADMVDFTCTALYDAGEGDGVPDEQGTSWHEVLMFEAVCCASNVDDQPAAAILGGSESGEVLGGTENGEILIGT